MKANVYLNYASRSLVRGGQRTVLAIFCVAVGVMSVVALQLVGNMINNAFTSNVRDANGGDIAVTSQTAPFTSKDLAFFDQLKSANVITNYTPRASLLGSVGLAVSASQSFSVYVVDPTTFPVVSPPTFQNPSNGQLSSLLGNDQVVIDRNLADQYQKKVGDTLSVHINAQGQGGSNLNVTIAGIVNDSGVFAQANDFLVVTASDYQAATGGAPLFYDTIDVTTLDKAHTDQASSAISARFPIASLTTADQALKNSQNQVALIQKFLELVGLLALLIGGVGIVNTMQVLLSRRRIEIATLKTSGYHRKDLYLLFGLEAGLLGLIGGVLGAAIAIGLSAVVRILVQGVFPISIPFQLDPTIVVGGVLIGLFTSLIFGLMPIVKAANIRPLSVIREEPDSHHIGNAFLTLGLVLLLSVLFCIMASTILKDSVWGIGAVYGTLIFLSLLSLAFGLVLLVVSKLPVPERFNVKQGVLVVIGLLLAAWISLSLPAFGILLLFFALTGILVVFLPPSTKSSVKLALRNIGRRRARTTTTLLALFIGVFTIGLILVLGEDLSTQINRTVANNVAFNMIAIAKGNDANALATHLNQIPGLSGSEQRLDTNVVPMSIDGVPLQTLIPRNATSGFNNLGTGVMYYLNGFEGFNVSQNQLPDTQRDFTIAAGRNLNSSDVGTHDILVNKLLLQDQPLSGHLHLGSSITFTSLDGKTSQSFTVVGTYTTKGLLGSFDPILTTTDAVQSLAVAGQASSVFYLKVDPNKIGQALNAIGQVAPNVGVFNLANLGDYIDRYIGEILIILMAVASLSLLAGAIIIANAVALAMLERRRELGILKSVGYTSGTVLNEVLVENGIIGTTGAALAMLLVTLVSNIVGRFVFKSSFGVSWYIALGLIVGVALLAMLTSALVAWVPARIKPLIVLRYE